MRRLGIFGGTFSPPHVGHVRAAEAFAEQMGLDGLLIVPTRTPPHKTVDGAVTAEERFEMCRRAFSRIKNAVVSDIEIRRGGKSYTYLTLEELAEKGTELYFLCGTDMILTLGEWKNPDRIFELATVCYVRREDDVALNAEIADKVAEYEREFSARIVAVEHTPLELSSTEIRQALARSEDANGLVDVSTLEYIRERGLYR